MLKINVDKTDIDFELSGERDIVIAETLVILSAIYNSDDVVGEKIKFLLTKTNILEEVFS